MGEAEGEMANNASEIPHTSAENVLGWWYEGEGMSLVFVSS